jgi:hypothetical protein
MLVIVDIDDTISDGSRRTLAAGHEPDRRKDTGAYNAWRDKINTGLELDAPVTAMRELVTALVEAGHHVAYVTARGSELREVTRGWLRQFGFPDEMLYMRAATDFRPSAEYKEFVVSKLLTSDLEDVLVIDDDPRGELAEVCRRRGWTFLKAGFGRSKQ